MKKLLAGLVVALGLLAAPGAARADFFFFAYLLPENEVPPARSQGYGYFVGLLADDYVSYLYCYCEFYDLTTPASAGHIHAGGPGVNGPVVLGFRGVPANTSGRFDGFYGPADFAPGGGLRTWEDFLVALFSGQTYVNIHSRMFPGGEIRDTPYYYEE